MNTVNTVTPTNEKIQDLEAQIILKKAERKQLAMQDDSAENDEALEKIGLDLYKLNQLIKAEVGNIAKAEIAAKVEAERNKRKAIATDFEALVLAHNSAKGEAKAELSAQLDTARESLINELLSGKAAPVRTATAKADGTAKVSAKSAEIVAMYVQGLNEGLDHTKALASVVATGVPKGSAWGPVDKYRIANGLK